MLAIGHRDELEWCILTRQRYCQVANLWAFESREARTPPSRDWEGCFGNWGSKVATVHSFVPMNCILSIQVAWLDWSRTQSSPWPVPQGFWSVWFFLASWVIACVMIFRTLFEVLNVAAKDLSSPDLEVLVTQEGEERCCIAREREGGSRNCITHPCSLQPQTDRIELPKRLRWPCVCADSFWQFTKKRFQFGILGCFFATKVVQFLSVGESTRRGLTFLRISLCLKSISILSKKAELFEGYWYHLLDDSRNGFLSISSLAVIHLWGFSMVSYTNCRSIEILMTEVQGAQWWHRICDGNRLHTLNFDPSGSPGKSFHGRRIGPKLEKARRVLQFGSWTGFVQRGIVSNVYAIRDFIWYPKCTLCLGDGPTCFLCSVLLGLGSGCS